MTDLAAKWKATRERVQQEKAADPWRAQREHASGEELISALNERFYAALEERGIMPGIGPVMDGRELQTAQGCEVAITFTVTDTRTGQTVSVEGSPFEWADNNWSCDCNRERLFGRDSRSGYCLGCKRYIVTSVDPMPEGYEVKDFNAGYDL
jgi:hypothetical protein